MTVPIYYLITDLDWGGAEKNLVALVTHLPPRFSPAVGCLFHAARAAEPLREAGIPVDCFEIERARDLPRLTRLVRRLRRGRFALLHSFLFHANLAGRLAAALAGTPRVVSSVRVAERRRWQLAADGLTQALVDRELCAGHALLRFTARHARVSPRKLRAVPNAVELPPDPPARDTHGPCHILGVGRYDPQKRWEDLVEALARLDGLDWEARIVGVGPREPLQQLVAARGLAGRIELLGPSYPLDPHYRWADLFALPSLWEGMPNVVLEAMAWGLPVVATTAGAVPELIEHGCSGWLVPPRDPRRLAERLSALADDAPARLRMGAAGRQRAACEFTVERMVGVTVALYDSLLRGPARGGTMAS